VIVTQKVQKAMERQNPHLHGHPMPAFPGLRAGKTTRNDDITQPVAFARPAS
jgi:hypothetical protein